MGRGCTFCDCGDEIEAIASEGCYKLHETNWLEEYPANIPTDIFEVRRISKKLVRVVGLLISFGIFIVKQ